MNGATSLFTLNRPCATCVVRKDTPFLGLRPGRKEEIAEATISYGAPFTCHKLTEWSNEDEATNEAPRSTNLPWDHCAGLRAMLEADPDKYSVAYVNIARRSRPDLHEPVDLTGVELYDSIEDWIAAGRALGEIT